ncbi:MAG: GAF domain-containing protein [Thermodesulfobacteriota bacterium]
MAQEKDFFTPFCKVSRAFGTAATKSELLDLIVKSAIDNMEGKAACLFLADEKKDVFVPVVQSGLSSTYLHASPIRARRTVNALVDDGYLAIKDATTDERAENHAAKKAEGIASILIVPVMVRDHPIGVLSLYTSVQRDFNEAEINFLRALAEQGGMAIENARLLERIQKNSLLFLELAASINSTLDIKTILNNLTVEVCAALGMKGATIRLLDRKTNELKLVANHGLSEKFLTTCHKDMADATKPVLEGETIAITDINTDPRIHIKECLANEGIGAMIITPVKSRNEIIGTLKLYSDHPRLFPPDVITLVKALAHQGGMAIHNASMYLEIQEDKNNLEKDIWSHRSWF